ncbi:3-keto-5-aminohexanoate cleavage protein [Motiliproteus sp. MSK22-1]|uniref:3-keto-5-aminohexanoate cleavage protein n=1 Tax=Motiliproteus sp. MSK22-1 TaxID=1897630 RepID=UPI0009755619|nr:3-keto-5-aminohexanoate cleavage protein [Motiliproteus sp. MSK22-1]OMH38055.1 class III aminotransferase [Motiliproteus sp. MSK22-1]
MQPPCLIMVAPNGARRSKNDHPALPVTPEEMAEEVAACVAAGAAMVHLHSRDKNGQHSLEIDDNAAMLRQVTTQLGDQVVIQLTTEAVGVYQPDQQMKLIKELQPEAASFAIKELIPDDSWLDKGAEFFSWVQSKGILAQYIIYSAEELERYFNLVAAGVLPAEGHHLLFVLGRYQKKQQSDPRDLLAFLNQYFSQSADLPSPPWATCAFGQLELQCLASASSMGGDVRVGFENNILRPDGSQAQNNAEQVGRLRQVINDMGRTVHSATSLRQFYNLR